MVTQTDVNDFRILYRARFNLDIGVNEARRKLELLVRQMELVYQPITKQQLQTINENNYEQSKPKPAADSKPI